jgi:HK97 family phage prohead protease
MGFFAATKVDRPDFTETEDVSPDWAEGDWGRPNLEDHPEFEGGTDFADAAGGKRAAVAARFIDGDPNAGSYSELRYPVVNPATGKLNRNGVAAAKSRASAQEDNRVLGVAQDLWNEHFDMEESALRPLMRNKDLGAVSRPESGDTRIVFFTPTKRPPDGERLEIVAEEVGAVLGVEEVPVDMKPLEKGVLVGASEQTAGGVEAHPHPLLDVVESAIHDRLGGEKSVLMVAGSASGMSVQPVFEIEETLPEEAVSEIRRLYEHVAGILPDVQQSDGRLRLDTRQKRLGHIKLDVAEIVVRRVADAESVQVEGHTFEALPVTGEDKKLKRAEEMLEKALNAAKDRTDEEWASRMDPGEEKTDFPEDGDDETPILQNSKYDTPDYDFVASVKENNPEAWELGGNQRGNDAFEMWTRFRDGERSDAVKGWVYTRENWADRHGDDGSQFNDEDGPNPTPSNVGGVMAQLKWGVVPQGEGTLSEQQQTDIILAAIKTIEERDKDAMDLIQQAQSLASELKNEDAVTEDIETALKNKVEEHNDEHGDTEKHRVTYRMLKNVFKRGIGAFRNNPGSVRENVQSEEQWALARVNSFLYAVRNENFEGGEHDRDLMPDGHPLKTESSSYKPTASKMDLPQEQPFALRAMEEEMEEAGVFYPLYHNKELAMIASYNGEVHEHMFDGVDKALYMPNAPQNHAVEEAPDDMPMADMMKGMHEEEEMEESGGYGGEDEEEEDEMKSAVGDTLTTSTEMQGLEIKSDEDGDFVFNGYGAVFGNKDRGDDILQKGSFKQTINRNDGKFPLVTDHQLKMQSRVGFVKAQEDRNGVKVEAHVNTEKQLGREIASDIRQAQKHNLPIGMSFGYEVREDEYDKEKDARILKEVKAHEFSLTQIPMNPKARVTGIKSFLEDDDALEELARKIAPILSDDERLITAIKEAVSGDDSAPSTADSPLGAEFVSDIQSLANEL